MCQAFVECHYSVPYSFYDNVPVLFRQFLLIQAGAVYIQECLIGVVYDSVVDADAS